MADGNIRLTAPMCKACENCGDNTAKTFKGLCQTCGSLSKKIKRQSAKRRENNRLHLPPLLRIGPTPQEILPCVCMACGASFKPKTKDRNKFCGRECGLRFTGLQAALRRNGGRVFVLVDVRRARCLHCQSRFTQTNANERYCSDTCRGDAAEAARITKEKGRYIARQFKCKCCGVHVVTQYGQTRKAYCSDACMEKSVKRISRCVRDARIRGAAHVERVDPTRVFKRDAWKCGICGKPTLKSKRGQCHPRAPELDHIQTLADGGSHSYANTQCACRACNLAKGAKTYGQLHLFPAG